MKKTLLFILVLTATLNADGGEIKYPVSDIPDELKQNVNVVIREDHMKFKILEKNRATHYVHYVVTVFNEKGKDYASRDIDYDKLTRIVDLVGVVYDAQGNVIKKLKNKEIYDHASHDGFTLFSDNRIKSMDLSQSIYPYTVEFEYTLDYRFLYYIPGWWDDDQASYQHVSYELSSPPSLMPRYKLFNIDVTPSTLSENGFETFTWIFKDIKPMNFEPFGPPRSEIVPHIIAAPSEFEYEGYRGNMTTWKEYGLWQLHVNGGRDQLSEQTKARIKELVQGKNSIEEKTEVLYEFLQNKTRYVNIAEGIGGLQPFPALVVDEMGYGDCKALSNFMVSILKEVGIKAYYTKIYAGERNKEMQIDFPSHQTNHIIVSVPNGKDTLWLECTNQMNPFGYQGTFTGDRWALMITDDGGKLVRTIKYTADQNVQSRTAQVAIDAAGNARTKIRTTNKGIQYENGDLNWVFGNSDKQKKWIEKNTQIPNFSINSFSMIERKNKIPSATVNLDLILNRYASVSGKRLFMSPNLMNKNSYVPPKIEERKFDVVLKSNYLDLDTIYYTFPENLYPEFIPEPIKINSKFGEYEASFEFDAGKVTYIRRMKVWKGRFPKETYNELVDFYKNVSKADNIKLVFLNKT